MVFHWKSLGSKSLVKRRSMSCQIRGMMVAVLLIRSMRRTGIAS